MSGIIVQARRDVAPNVLGALAGQPATASDIRHPVENHDGTWLEHDGTWAGDDLLLNFIDDRWCEC